MFLFLLGIWKRIPPEFGPSRRQKQLVSKTSEMHTDAKKILVYKSFDTMKKTDARSDIVHHT